MGVRSRWRWWVAGLGLLAVLGMGANLLWAASRGPHRFGRADAEAVFAAIELGMTPRQVNEVINPGEERLGPPADFTDGRWDQWKGKNYLFVLNYQHGRLVHKNLILPDRGPFHRVPKEWESLKRRLGL